MTVPTVIGDLLLSMPADRTNGEIQTPTFENTKLVISKEAQFLPCGLQQKIAVVEDDLVVGWSGCFREAKETITSLYYLQKSGGLNINMLRSYLQGNDGPGYIGFLREGQGFHQFGFRYKRLESSILGRVGILGSGGDCGQKLLKQLEWIGESHLNGPSMGDRAVARSLFYSGSLLSAELLSGSNYSDYFGAGYEIATLRPEGFRKLDGITFAFWLVEIVSPTRLGISKHPFHICSLKYTNDILTIRSIVISKENDAYRSRHWYTHVPPIYRDPSEQEMASILPPDLNNKWLCNYFIVPSKSVTFCQVHCLASGNATAIHFQEHADRTVIAVESEFLTSVANNIGARFYDFKDNPIPDGQPSAAGERKSP